MRTFRNIAFALATAMALVSLPGTALAHESSGTIVAVGDSYASGEGGSPYLPGSDTATNQCYRSTTGPVVYTGAIRGKSVRNVACSGATTFNITTAGQYGEPRQAAQIGWARHVVVMIGGNDIGFGQLVGCFLQYDCDQTPLPAQTLQFIETELGPQLDAAYRAIRRAAPFAKVTVTLYPPLLPPNGAPVGPNCPQFNAGEIQVGNAVQAALNSKITARARAHYFGVANPAPFFAGYDVCSANPDFYLPGPDVPQAAWLHPNIEGRVKLGAVAAYS